MVSLKLTVLGQLTIAVVSNVVTIKGDENGVQGHIDTEGRMEDKNDNARHNEQEEEPVDMMLQNFLKEKLSILQDIVFKTVFSETDILMQFLNDVIINHEGLRHLEIQEIDHIIVRNSELMAFPGCPQPRVRFDVFAQDRFNNSYNIEMQREFGSFKDVRRFQFYACQHLVREFHELANKLLSTRQTATKKPKKPRTRKPKKGEPLSTTILTTIGGQGKETTSASRVTKELKKLDVADIYRMLTPVIVVVITDEPIPLKSFTSIKSEIINCVSKPIYGAQALVNEVFIDLGRVKIEDVVGDDDTGKWMHFLRHADGKCGIDQQTFNSYSQNPGMNRALKKLESLASNDVFVETVRRAEIKECDLREEGRKEGMKEARKEARKEVNEDYACAISLIKEDKLSSEEIAKKCNIDLAVVHKLKDLKKP